MSRTKREAVPTWSTWHELLSVISYPPHLKRTATIAVAVGTVFFAMNQLGTVLAGHATPLVWLKGALTYVTPLCVSNLSIASATHRREP